MNAKLIAVGFAALALAGCTTTDPFTGETQLSNTAGGGLLGAGGGAVAGAIIGAATGNDPRVGALVGAGFGGLAGAAIGSYMDQQEAELRAQLQGTGVSVTRVGNQIILNMPANITFATDEASVQPQFRQTLASVALVLNRFNKTMVDVYGHTNSDGADDYNQQLSQRRALSVASVLQASGVDQRRFYILGRGEAEPVASNATASGKAQNRRVEI